MSTPSPVTDGTLVWVMTGTGSSRRSTSTAEKWVRDIPKDYGRFGLNWGYGSSPLLYGDALYVQVLHGMRTAIRPTCCASTRRPARTVWRVERPTAARFESPDSYTTPALLRYGASTEIVVTGGDVVTGHDPATGKELWRANGLNPDNDGSNRIVASPVVHGDMIYAPSRERPLLALKAGGRGDITKSHVVWSFNNGPDVPTPVSDGTYLYVVNDRGILFCLDAKPARRSTAGSASSLAPTAGRPSLPTARST
jgi:outer membrane protein assembly factor BamB